MNKYIAPLIAFIIICMNFVFLGDMMFTFIHIVMFLLLSIILIVMALIVYGIINFFVDTFSGNHVGLSYFGVFASIIIVVSVVVATPSLSMPLMFRSFTSNFEGGWLDDVPERLLVSGEDLESKDFFLVDGFKFSVPNNKIYSRSTNPFRTIQLSEDKKDQIIVFLSTEENLGDTIYKEIRNFAYTGKDVFHRGDDIIETFSYISELSNYEIYKTIAMTTASDFEIGSDLEEIIHSYEMLTIKYLTLPGNPERESYYFESDDYSALVFGSRVDFYKDNRHVTLVFDEGVSKETLTYIVANAEFDEVALTDDYIPTNIPATYDEDSEETIYEYATVEEEAIPAGGLVFNNKIGIEPGNKLSMRLNVGVSEAEDILLDQIIFNVDNEYDEIRIRNRALNIVVDKEGAKVSKELFCGNYEEYTDELVTKDLEFFKEIVSSRNVEIKFIADGYTKVHQVSESEKIQLQEFILLYEMLLARM